MRAIVSPIPDCMRVSPRGSDAVWISVLGSLALCLVVFALTGPCRAEPGPGTSSGSKPKAAAGPKQPVSHLTEEQKAAEDAIGDLGRPYNLPQASMARVRECGIEWQAMKMSGAAENKIWRVFASVCLAKGPSSDATK